MLVPVTERFATAADLDAAQAKLTKAATALFQTVLGNGRRSFQLLSPTT